MSLSRLVRPAMRSARPTIGSSLNYSSLSGMRIPGASRYRNRRPKRVAAQTGLTSHGQFPAQYDAQFTVSNPGGILKPSDSITRILSQPTLVIERRLEMMSVFLGVEQANRYTISDPQGTLLGYMEEEDLSIVKVLMRQVYRLHRPFKVKVTDPEGNHVLTIRRPFSFINSHIKALLPDSDTVVGETKQQWHLWRRRYNLFQSPNPDVFDQFGYVDAPFLSFAFPVKDENNYVIGTVDRNWVGIGRELFTDTGVYILRMDPSSFVGMEDYYPEIGGPLTLDQRAVMLGTAVSIDFDYFSRHSNRGGFFPVDYE